MESIEFTESEIQEELARLGYQNVPPEKLRDFKRGKWVTVCLVLL